MPNAHERRFPVGRLVLSALEAVPVGTPRGVVIAIHGSGYTSKYWDCLHESANSLLRVGSDLGFRVIAIDRPGYGLSRDADSAYLGIDAQSAVLGEFIADLRAESPAVPIFLIGHSLGSVIAVRLAAVDAAEHIAGIDVVGLPVQWRSDIRVAVEALLNGESRDLASEPARLAMYFGPPGTYDPRVLSLERLMSQRVPRREMQDSLTSQAMLAELGPLVRVPVQHTVAEFEGSVAGGEAVLAQGYSLFCNSLRVVSYLQTNTGHNVSLHKVGRAYHLRAMTFFEEIIACRARSAIDASPVVDGVDESVVEGMEAAL
jgi:pimeloyl-ACP methyl ester carboxylesterase